MSVTINRPLVGQVLEISIVPTGSNLTIDHAIGVSTLYVEDVTDFNPEGGQLTIDGVVYSYTAINYELDTIALTTTLAVAQNANQPIYIYPPSMEKWALVQTDSEDDAVRARVPHELYDKFVDGIREDSARESVLVVLERNSWVVQNINALEPAVDGQYIVDGSINQSKVSFDAHTLGAQHIYQQSAAPTGQLVDDVWIDTGNGNIMKRWDGSTWQLIDDSRISQALTLAGSKNTVFRQSSPPATGIANNDLWIDTDDGKLYVYQAGWQLSDDQRIATALTNAANAQASADNVDAINLNPSFSTWSNPAAAPDQWFTYINNPTRETSTSLVRTPPYAARFNCTDTTTIRGLQQTGQVNLPIGLQYVTVTIDVLLNSGTTFGGSGLLLDWVGMTGSIRNQINLSAEIPAPATGKWYRVTKVLQRPAAATGTQTSWSMWVMGQFSTGLGTVSIKDVVFNRVAVRPSTVEEISAYNAAPQSTVTALTTTVNTKTTIFNQISAPSTSGRVVGDLWIDTDDNQRVYVWNGSAWTLTDIANYNYIVARATDLVTNGTGALGTNQNFTQFDLNLTDVPTGASASFVAKTTSYGQAWIDEYIAFDPTKKYKFGFQIKQTVAGQSARTAYGFLVPFDAFNNSISPQHYVYITGTTTTLAAALNPGDTTVTLTSSANWYGTAAKPAGTSTHLRAIIFWDYVDPAGKAWPVESYSRNWSGSDYWADGGITGNVITLRAPYAGPAKPAGTPLSNASAGGSFMYMPSCTNVAIPETWTTFSDVFSAGVMSPASQASTGSNGATWAGGVPPGTAKVKVGWLLNGPSGSGGKHAVAAISFSDASAAYDRAAHITTYYQTSQPASGMIVGDFWVDTDDSNKLYRYSGSVWQVAQDQGIAQAITAAAGAQATADGKVRLYAQISAPTGLLASDDGDLWVDTDDSNKLYRFNGGTLAWVLIQDAAGALAQANTALTTANGKNKVTWSTSLPGSTANLAGDIWFVVGSSGGIIGQYQGTGGTSWVSQTLQDSVIASLTAAKITTGQLSAGQRIIAGPSSGTHAELTDTGLYAYAEDPVDNIPNQVVKIGTSSNDVFALSDTAGNVKANISDTGVGSFTGLSVDGNDDGTGIVFSGTEFQDWLSPKAFGTVAQAYYPTSFTSGPITTEYGIAELSFNVDPARSYIFIFPGVYWKWDTVASSAVFSIRYTTDGSVPTITSTLWDTVNCVPGNAGLWYSSTPMILEGQWNVAAGTPVRILVTLRRGYGTGNVYWGIDSAGTSFPRKFPRLILLDSGFGVDETWVGNDGGGTGGSGGTSGGGGVVKKTYVTTWNSTGSGTYQGSGNKRSDTSDVVQGYNSFNGDGQGLWVFPSITAALTGATVNKIEVYAYSNFWYYNSGGTALIKVHGYTAVPASSPSMTTAINSAGWTKPGGKWVTLPSSTYASFKSGTYRGFGMGPSGGTNLLYYGRFNGSGAKLRVTYTK